MHTVFIVSKSIHCDAYVSRETYQAALIKLTNRYGLTNVYNTIRIATYCVFNIYVYYILVNTNT